MSKGTNDDGKPQVYGVVGMAMRQSPLHSAGVALW